MQSRNTAELAGTIYAPGAMLVRLPKALTPRWNATKVEALEGTEKNSPSGNFNQSIIYIFHFSYFIVHRYIFLCRFRVYA